jgi:hypothetical protein
MQKTTPGMLLGQTSKLPVGGDGDLPVSSEKAMRQTGDHLRWETRGPGTQHLLGAWAVDCRPAGNSIEVKGMEGAVGKEAAAGQSMRRRLAAKP